MPGISPQFGLENSAVNGALADASIVKLMNPMNYIGAEDTTTAPHWRIRHGTLDSDTSFAIPPFWRGNWKIQAAALTSLCLGSAARRDYDLEDLFSWTTQVCSDPNRLS